MSALFEMDDYAPITVKQMRCAACIGQGCARCGEEGRLGSSIWRGASFLSSIVCQVTPDAEIVNVSGVA